MADEMSKPRTIAVTGASGLVGRALIERLQQHGHRVLRLVRAGARGGADTVAWDATIGVLEPGKLEGVDVVVHLAGENVAGLWTAARKRRIHDSRVVGTRVLSESLAKLTRRPGALVCASAVGFYGSRGDEVLDESSARGAGFLPDVCVAWERSADPARAAGMRVAHLRLGIVLTPAGGALASMLPVFRAGLGGVLGPGTQWMPWVGLDDVVSAFTAAALDDRMAGIFNVVSPEPVTNRQFTGMLGRVLRRPTFMHVPTFVLKLAGQMGREMLLSSQNIRPRRLTEAGFAFADPLLEPMLRRLLGL